MQNLLYKNTLAIVVLYNQTIEESLTLQSLNCFNENESRDLHIYVYDNSPQPQYELNEFNWKGFKIHYVSDTTNGGVSAAYNAGALYAKKNEKLWLLLLDQDTKLAADFFKKNQLEISANQNINLFVPMLKLSNGVFFSPVKNKHKRGYPLKNIQSGIYSLKKYAAVNSGMIVNIEAFFLVGGYNPRVKLDFCDFQFLERFAKKFDTFYVVETTGMQDFSNFDKSILRQKARFLLYLKDASSCEKSNLSDKIGFLYTVTRHSIGLAVKLGDFSFISLFVKKFLFRQYE